MDALSGIVSPALTTATQAAGAYQGAEANAAQVQRDTMLNAMVMMRQQKQFQTDQALKTAQTGYYNSRGNYYDGRTPTDSTSSDLRAALVAAGHDPDDVDAAIAADRMGNPAGLRSLFAPPKTAAPRILRTPTGYMTAPSGGGAATPVVDGDGNPVMPIIRPPANRAAASNGAVRQGLSAVNTQLKDTRGQLNALSHNTPPLVAYPGSSPARPTTLLQRVTSLLNVLLCKPAPTLCVACKTNMRGR